MPAVSSRIALPGISRVIALLMVTALPVNIALAQPYGMNTRPLVGTFLNGKLPPAQQSAVGWQVVQAFPNLTFDDPISLVPEPRTNRLYVCERQGKIFFFQNNPATTGKTLFLDLTAATQGYDDCGVMGIAFHPQYGVAGSTNRSYVYVYYQFSENPTSGPGRPPSATPGFNRLSRFTVPNGSLVADRASELVMINQYDRHVWHNGGGMFFGPDGFLYVSNGDEGAANDSYSQSQEINSGLFSGVLRIDVDRDPTRSHPIRRQPVSDQSPPVGWTNVTFTAHYFIPNDNPWVNTNGIWLEEFYAIGLRSPHRMTHDLLSGRIWVGDVGQGTREEVDIIEKGGNYQWAYRQGTVTGPKAQPNPIIGVDRPPVYDYGRGAGDTCVIGGYVYRGLEHADTLYGKYIFGDNTSGRIWSMTYDGTNAPVVVELLDTGWPNNYQGLSGFGVDNNNELYLCKMGRPSAIYKLARPGSQPPAPPALLSQTGAFTNLATLSPATNLIPFDVNSALWSDGAAKRRWIVLPTDGAPYGTNETIKFNATNEWDFPVGTVLVKHFELGVNRTNPAVIKRLETRFLVHATNSSWYGLTYKWRADQSDADLLPGGLTEAIPIQTAGNVITQNWQYPSRQDCMTCHNETAKRVLGVKTRQLNGDFHYPATGVIDNQLRTWSHLGLFDAPINTTNIPGYDKLVEVTNQTAILEHRVRSYLDANCAHCHRPNGAAALFDARYTTPLLQQGLIDGAVVDPLGVPGAVIVAPRNVSRSLLHLRDNTLGSIQMPPLARNVIDTNYINILAQWINTLPVPGGPPAPWSNQDVGPVGVAGNAVYSSGVFTVTASGVDIWSQEDSFHFVHQPLNGDGVLTARVMGLSNTTEWALAGVMIRQSLAADSQHAMLGVTAQQGISFTRRATPGAASLYTAGASSGAPYWVRLTRVGNTITAHNSPDGVTWALVGSQVIAMSGPVYAGLAYTSCVNGTLGTATFDNVTLTVPATNTPPVFVATPPGVTLPELTLLTVTNAATDADLPANILTYQLLAPPTGATINTNGVITWNPSEAQGPTNATLTTVVSDGQASATNSFLVMVSEVNQSPSFLVAPATVLMDELTLLIVTNSAVDADVPGQALIYSLLASPVGAAINTNGVITWTPSEQQGPTNVTLTTVVSDGQASATNSFVVTVIEVNQSPAFVETPESVLMDELTLLSVTNSATDADLPGQALIYTLLGGPVGAAINTNGVITWTPSEAQGPTNVTLTTVVSDGQASATNSFLVTVTEVNQSSAFVETPDSVVMDELTLLSITNSATDADLPGQALIYSLLASPVGAAIDTNGVITWTPSEEQGPTNVTLTTVVSDGQASATNSFLVTVIEVNQSPAFVETPEAVVMDELTLLYVTNSATDGDVPGQALIYTLLGGPTGAAIDTNGVITWTPSEAQGPTNVTLTTVVSDGQASATNSFLVMVTEVNQSPAFVETPESVVMDELTLLSVTNSATDADLPSQTLIYTLLGGPTGAGIDTNGVITWTPSEEQGPTNVTLTTVVSDGLASATNSFMVTVLEVNVPPTANPDALVRFASQGVQTTSTNLLSNDTDPDGDVLTLFTLWSPSPAGSIVTNAAGIISYQPPFGDTNSGGFNYVIIDGKGGMATGLVSIAVMPDPPAIEMLGIQPGAGRFMLSFTGIPGFVYTVLYTDTLQPPDWQQLGVATASESGLVQMEDTSPGGGPARYYRAVRGVAH